jgi:hypothetical protein
MILGQRPGVKVTHMFNTFNSGSAINEVLVMAVKRSICRQRSKVSVAALPPLRSPSLGGTSRGHSELCPRGTRFIWQFYQFLASSTS